jgi:glycosyltransferase involved in cell wall biosynthesis
MKIWLDVEDLFEYARVMSRPSGIQRLSFELYAALQDAAGDRIGFVRHDPMRNTAELVEWGDVEALYHGMVHGRPGQPAVPAPPQPAPEPQPLPLREGRLVRMPVVGAVAQAVARRLPTELRQPLGQAVRAQIVVVGGLVRMAAAVPGVIAARRGRAKRREEAERLHQEQLAAAAAAAATAEAAGLPAEPEPTLSVVGRDLRDVAQPGDVFLVLGSPWSHPDYPGFISRVIKPQGLRFGMLVYDLIPLLRPEFCDRGLVALFSRFMRGCLPQTDKLMTISDATSADVAAWARREGIALLDTPSAIPIGTGFAAPPVSAPLPDGLWPGNYALFVSTIEARKNHVLAFRAWRRLLEEMPPEKVPTLVFAGRVGWMIADLMQALHNSRYLNGKLVLVENPDDATLAALYRGARFTLFPSLYEGWGLPVSESLAFGKVCLAAGRTSVPEAGGPFCLYHDPDSVTDAVALYRRAIEEPDLIPGLEARIASEYRPTPWSSSAQAVLDKLV